MNEKVIPVFVAWCASFKPPKDATLDESQVAFYASPEGAPHKPKTKTRRNVRIRVQGKNAKGDMVVFKLAGGQTYKVINPKKDVWNLQRQIMLQTAATVGGLSNCVAETQPVPVDEWEVMEEK